MADAPEAQPWHRGSRFYKIGLEALRMAFLFVILAGVWRPEHVQIAMGAFSLVVGLLLGGSTWVNAKERDVEQARVTNGGGAS